MNSRGTSTEIAQRGHVSHSLHKQDFSIETYESEKCLLSCLLHSMDILESGDFSVDDTCFQDPWWRRLFDRIMALHRDFGTMKSEQFCAVSQQYWGEFGGAAALSEIIKSTLPETAEFNWRTYQDALLEASRKRQALANAERAIDVIASGGSSGEAIEVLNTPIDSRTVRKECISDTVYVPFPIELLPDPYCHLVANIAALVGADESFAALPMLAAAAGMMGRSCVVEIQPGFQQPAAIWVATVGLSGDGKSPCQSMVLSPVRDIQRDAWEEYCDQKCQYDDDMADFKRDIDQWRKSKTGDRPSEPIPPPQPALIIDDATTEGVSKAISENPRGLLYGRDELDGFFAGMDRYAAKGGGRGADVSFWLSCYDGGANNVIRSGAGMRATNGLLVSICGGTQPKVLRSLMRGHFVECGLFNRVWMAYPPAIARKPDRTARLDAYLSSQWGNLLRKLDSLKHQCTTESIRGNRRTFRFESIVVGMTDEARELWFASRDRLEARRMAAAASDESLSGFYSKMQGGVARLALVIHLMAHAFDYELGSIEVGTMENAIVLGDWFCGERERINRLIASQADKDRLLDVARWIGAQGGHVTLRQLRRKYNLGPEAAEKLANAVVRQFGGRREVVPASERGGRPSDIVVLHADLRG